MAQKLQVFDDQDADGTSLVMSGLKGGFYLVSVTKASDLGGGKLEVCYTINGNLGPVILAGTISSLSESSARVVEIPFETSAFLELSGSSGASVTAWISDRI